MSGNHAKWPRHMKRKYACPPEGAWYCCGGRLMRSMADPNEPGVQLHQCPRCGIAVRARGAVLLETMRPQVEESPELVGARQLTLFDM